MTWWAYDQAMTWLKKKYEMRWHIEGQRARGKAVHNNCYIFSARSGVKCMQTSAPSASLAARRLDALLSVKAQLPRLTVWTDRGLQIGDAMPVPRSLADGKRELAVWALANLGTDVWSA